MAASHQPGTTASMPKVTCFHDSECPICNIESYAMKKLDKEGNINWVDITRDKAALAKAGLTYKKATDRMHVIDENQQLQSGVPGFFTWLEAASLLPVHCHDYRERPLAIAVDGILLSYFRSLSFAAYWQKTNQRIALMNRINPNKLLLSKWTAVKPKQKECHFIVTKLIRAENEDIIACELEAVINNNLYEMDLEELKDSSCWLIGWY